MILKNKIAVIIGASRGIGLTTAKLFVKEGATVIGTYNNSKPTLRKVDFYKLDITNREEVEKFVEKIVKKYNKIDILVNNAGITSDSLTRKMSYDQFDKVIMTNLVGTFNVTRLIGPHMQENKSEFYCWCIW